MNKVFIALLAIALVVCDSDMDSLIFNSFQKFIKKYNKKYSSIDEFLSSFQNELH